MKKIFVLVCGLAFAACKKEAEAVKPQLKPVIVQMEVVNKAGNSTFYLQQVVK